MFAALKDLPRERDFRDMLHTHMHSTQLSAPCLNGRSPDRIGARAPDGGGFWRRQIREMACVLLAAVFGYVQLNLACEKQGE